MAVVQKYKDDEFKGYKSAFKMLWNYFIGCFGRCNDVKTSYTELFTVCQKND